MSLKADTNPFKSFRWPLAFLLALALAGMAHGQVCYNPVVRGHGVASYQLDTFASPWHSYRLDLSSVPDWSYSPADRLRIQQRYGPFTGCTDPGAPECEGHSFKRWAGGGNEVKAIWGEALALQYQQNKALLGPACSGPKLGIPTETEITDALAVNDRSLVDTWHPLQPGGTPENPIPVCVPSRLKGPYEAPNLFWGWTDFYVNTCGTEQGTTPTPQPPAPVCGDGRCEAGESCASDCKPAPEPPVTPSAEVPKVCGSVTTVATHSEWEAKLDACGKVLELQVPGVVELHACGSSRPASCSPLPAPGQCPPCASTPCNSCCSKPEPCPKPTPCPACPALLPVPAGVQAILAKDERTWTRAERLRLQKWGRGAQATQAKETP